MLYIKDIVDAIKTVYDPEVPVNVCDLGLIYGVEIFPIGNVYITITLTSPNCPAAEQIPAQIDQAVRSLEHVNDVRVEITFDPPYDIKMLSTFAKYELGFM